MRLAESLGAETVTLTGPKASEEILNYARDRNVTKIITGKPTHPQWKDKLFGSMLDELVRGSGDIEVYVISGDTGEPVKSLLAIPGRPKPKVKEWLFGLGVVGASTGLAFLMLPYFAIVDLAMVYLLGVVIAAGKTEPTVTVYCVLQCGGIRLLFRSSLPYFRSEQCAVFYHVYSYVHDFCCYKPPDPSRTGPGPHQPGKGRRGPQRCIT